MSYHDRLLDEINERLDVLALRKQKWVPQWIAHEVCLSHRAALLADGIDREFWEHSAYMHVRRVVTQVINKRSGDTPYERQPTQLTLNGFNRDRLQDYYVVVRDEEEVAVPIIGNDAITDDELDVKVTLYRSMGAACYQHADEIVRFKRWRKTAAA